MASHNTSSGACLDTAVLSVTNLTQALTFYHDALGLDVLEQGTEVETEYLTFWGLAPDIAVRYAFLGLGPDAVGRILLLEFETPHRKVIRESGTQCGYGLFNLNFYTQDIRGDHKRFEAAGFSFWSSPVQHDFGEHVGQPIEVVFDGPDNVAINPVQLESLNSESLIADMRRYSDEYGRSEQGFTPVVTSAHFVKDIAKAIEFHETVLDMHVAIDRTLSSAESNHFLGLAEGSETRTVFVQGNHMYGKVCLVAPQNYDCVDLVSRAVAPNVGYLAQVFKVPSLADACEKARAYDALLLREPEVLACPGYGKVSTMLLRHSGSGALIQLYQS